MADAYLFFEGMTWPDPTDPLDVEWSLRYGTPTSAQLRVAASMIAAYKQLVTDSVRSRNAKIAALRTAVALREVPLDGGGGRLIKSRS